MQKIPTVLSTAQRQCSFLASQMCLSEEGAEIFVAGPIFHQHGQESAILHRQVRADDRTYALLSAGGRKPLRAVNTIAIEQRDSGQSKLRRARGELLRERSAAEKTEGAAGMQFDVGHVSGNSASDRSELVCNRRNGTRKNIGSAVMDRRYRSRCASHKFPRLPSPLRVPGSGKLPPSSNCKSHSVRPHFFSSHQSPEAWYGPCRAITAAVSRGENSARKRRKAGPIIGA